MDSNRAAAKALKNASTSTSRSERRRAGFTLKCSRAYSPGARRRRRNARLVLVAVALFAALPTEAAGHPPVRTREQIVSAIRQRLGLLPRPGRLCVRLPERGPEAVVVVQRRSARSRAYRLLRSAKIRGIVEVHTHAQYERLTEELSRSIATQIPQGFPPGIHVSAEASAGHLECMRASIELPTPANTPPAVVAWARSEVQRYGQDWVSYRFTPHIILF
jgi:hypothetical protein